MKFLYVWACALLVSHSLSAQIGGNHTYEFLTLSPSARVTALGGNLITVSDDDASLASMNPALLNAKMHQQINLNESTHFAGIGQGYASYAHHLEASDITLHGGIKFIHYGKFTSADDLGNTSGEFRASEFALVLGAAYRVSHRLSIGANLKPVFSYLEGYSSTGLVGDIGTHFRDTSKQITVAVVMQNIGTQFTTYNRSGRRELLPFDLQIGVSKRLAHLPFRFSIIGHNLHRWNIRYDDPNAQEDNSIFGEENNSEPSNFSKNVDIFFRHFIFNGEMLIGAKENFRLRVGYNHLRRQELNVENLRSLAGFSFGIGLKISKFRIDYGMGSFHLAGGAHHFSISTNLQEFGI